MEKTSASLAQDMIIEIVLQMPLKSLVKCTCVSKELASIIRSKLFRDNYLVRSMEMPRLLFIGYELGERYVLFHSVYQEEEPLLSSGQQPGCQISSPIKGLVCLQEKSKFTIFNPAGTKKFATLPEIQAGKRAAIISFFGYDEDSDVLKVLCMTKKEFDPSVEAKEHQVLTVGSGQDSWRPIGCKYNHSPVTQGLCKRGVLYYGAQSNSGKSIVMSFNVSSEEFTTIVLPEEVYIHRRCNLVNYNGKIASVDNHEIESSLNENADLVLEMWVMNETEGKWSRNCIEIPGWKETIGNTNFYFRGTNRTGELVFTSDNTRMSSLCVLYYDPATEKLTRYKIEGVDEGEDHVFQTSLDHIDSPLHI